jgi:hypothetical protein
MVLAQPASNRAVTVVENNAEPLGLVESKWLATFFAQKGSSRMTSPDV